MMQDVGDRILPGAAALSLVGGVSLLHPEDQVFAAMLEGWGRQQQSRFLAPSTIAARRTLVERFARWTNEYPWQWRPADLEEWTAAAVSERKVAHSTVRGEQVTLSLFCDYICDARYGWTVECETRFGSFPVQICHEWNTVQHRSEFEGRPGNRPAAWGRRAPSGRGRPYQYHRGALRLGRRAEDIPGNRCRPCLR